MFPFGWYAVRSNNTMSDIGTLTPELFTYRMQETTSIILAVKYYFMSLLNSVNPTWIPDVRVVRDDLGLQI